VSAACLPACLLVCLVACLHSSWAASLLHRRVASHCALSRKGQPTALLAALAPPLLPLLLPPEWFFRSSLDRYIWIYGMMCAFMHPK
jgi:hypothetical protein